MTKIYLFFGEHVNKSSLESFYSKIAPLLKELTKKPKLISILEYGGPPYFPKSAIPSILLSSESLLRQYFNQHVEVVEKDLIYFIKNRKHLDTVQIPEFSTLLQNFLLDIKCELYLEELSFEKYTEGFNYYYDSLKKEVELSIQFFMRRKAPPPNDGMKFHNRMNELRDISLSEQIKQISEENKDATFIIVRGSIHKEKLTALLEEKGFDLISNTY